MRWRMVAVVSLGLNLALIAAWLLRPARPGRAPQHPAGTMAGEVAPGTVRTNVVVRRQFFSWREVESPDYAVYIANLRDIGCPEQTIRDIIIADVNALYSKRLATEVITADQQWWRSEPDAEVLAAAVQKARELDEERRALLTRLLGPNWEARDLTNLARPSRQGIALDGPVLGYLPAETKEAIQEISARSEDRLRAYLEERQQAGLAPDPVELARLRQQTRDELSRVLAPQQLEEFLLRYSQNASNWRALFSQLQFFNPTADEFRAVFRATDNLDQRIELLGPGTDPDTVSARKALEEQRENAIRLALGPKRYEEYRLLQDPLYREAVAAAREAGEPESARKIYLVNLAAAEQLASIQANTNLTAAQKQIEINQLALDQLKATTVATGQELPPEPPQVATPPRRIYTLRQGDTLPVIALIHGVPVSAIQAANPNVNFSRLKPGDTITIPRSALGPVSTQ